MSETTLAVERCVERMNRGESDARDELMHVAFERLQRIAKKMMHGYERVGRWEQTDDVVQNASLRLYKSLQQAPIVDARHFYRLAALQIRRELVDLCRHYHGQLGLGANHQTQVRPAAGEASAISPAYELGEEAEDPQNMEQWSEFHEAVEKLPHNEREVFEMLWYHELAQEEVAQLVGLSVRQVKRIWRAAKLRLHDHLFGESH
jgi:RNA polymerase sigma factor (sigma-70 family)